MIKSNTKNSAYDTEFLASKQIIQKVKINLLQPLIKSRPVIQDFVILTERKPDSNFASIDYFIQSTLQKILINNLSKS